MTRPSFPTSISGACARLRSTGVPALAAIAFFASALGVPSQAGAQTTQPAGARGHGAVAHGHGARAHGAHARAHKAACSSTHVRHGAHACSPARGHRHKVKTETHRRHATGSHVSAQAQPQTPPAPAPAGRSSGTTCPNGLNATLDEEGTFACAGGGEPGCPEGFAPVVAGDGSTLVCEPEQVEGNGEEAG